MNPSWLRLLPAFLRKRIESRDYLQNVLGNMGWLFADRIVRMGIGLLVGVWVARYLGPEQFGLLSYAYAFVALFSALSTMGLDSIVVREIVRDPSREEEVLGSTFLLKVIGGVSSLCLVIGCITFLRPPDPTTRLLVSIIAVGMVFQAFDTIDYWFQSQILSKYAVYAKNTAFLIASIGKVVLILSKGSVLSFAVVGIVESIIGSIGLVLAYKKTGHNIKNWRARRATAGSLFKDSWPLMLSGVMIMIYMRIDQVMLGMMVGSKEVGVYSVAVQLSEAWYFLPISIVSSVYPSIIEAKKTSDSLFIERLQKLYKLMSFTGYCIAIPVTFFGGYVLEILYGKEYLAAKPMLIALIWSILFTNLGVARSSFLATMNWNKLHFFTVLGGCFLNIIINILLIPLYGGFGAAVASCVSYWFAAHGACFLYRPLFKTGSMMTKALYNPRFW